MGTATERKFRTGYFLLFICIIIIITIVNIVSRSLAAIALIWLYKNISQTQKSGRGTNQAPFAMRGDLLVPHLGYSEIKKT